MTLANDNGDDINPKDTCNMELVVGVEYHHSIPIHRDPLEPIGIHRNL